MPEEKNKNKNKKSTIQFDTVRTRNGTTAIIQRCNTHNNKKNKKKRKKESSVSVLEIGQQQH